MLRSTKKRLPSHCNIFPLKKRTQLNSTIMKSKLEKQLKIQVLIEANFSSPQSYIGITLEKRHMNHWKKV
jgi:hypothetical protein